MIHKFQPPSSDVVFGGSSAAIAATDIPSVPTPHDAEQGVFDYKFISGGGLPLWRPSPQAISEKILKWTVVPLVNMSNGLQELGLAHSRDSIVGICALYLKYHQSLPE